MGIWGRSTRLAAAGLAAAGLLGSLGVAGPAGATSSFSLARQAGPDRYGTAADLAEAALPSGAPGAILAAGAQGNFPDALAASYLAGYYSAPILLTDASSVPAATDQALKAMKVSAVAVVGGTSAVSDAVISHLKSEGYGVNRVAGATRYDTAAQVSAIPPTSHVGSAPGGGPTAVLASGANFPDALVSGPMGYASGFPIELTDPSSLSSQTRQSLQALGIKTVLIAGGTAAVSSAVESQVKALGIATQRFAGNDRTDTAARLAAYEVQQLGFSTSAIDLARGDDPGDSLAGAPYGGVGKTPLLLTENPNVLGQYDVSFLEAESGTLASGTIFGGTAAVSQVVQAQANNAGSGNGAVVSVSASPSTVGADGSSTSTVSVSIMTQSGSPVAGDTVTVGLSGSPSAACGAVFPTSGTTDSSGRASFTYTASTTAGTCLVTAAENSTGASGSTTITQSTANQVSVTATPSAVPDDGASQSQVTATVTSQSGSPVAGDTVNFTLTGNPSGACGTLASNTATTNSSGQASAIYTASKTEGFCSVTATESNNSSSGSTQITQTSAPAGTPKNTVSVTASPSSIPANGKSTSTITATVTNGSGPVSGDPVSFVAAAGTSGSCGSLSAPGSGTTNAQGQAVVTYTSSTTAGTCTITATEANTGGSGQTPVTQTTPYTVSVTASPSSVPDDGHTQSTVTAIVTDASKAPVPNDLVTFTWSGTPAAACGTVAPTSATTNSSGQASAIYTASTTLGFCTITATESASAQSSTVMISQSPSTSQPNKVTVQASPSTIQPDGSSKSTITVTVTDSGNTAIGGDQVTLTETPSVVGACGNLNPTSGSTSQPNGQMTSTYTASSTAGKCTITARESQTNATGSATVTQTSAIYTFTVTAQPSTIGANGYDTSTVTATVKDPSGTPVPNDAVTFALFGANPANACGTLNSTTASTGSTGTASVTYTTSKVQGSCQVSATDSTTSTGSVKITQVQPTIVGVAAVNNTTTLTVTYNEAIFCPSVESNGSQYSVTVNGVPLANLNGAISAAACPAGVLTSKTVNLTLSGINGNSGAKWTSGQVLIVTVNPGSTTHMTPSDTSGSPEPAQDANTGTVS